DTTPPVNSNMRATSVTTTGATIAWDTDEPTTGQVTYGPVGSFLGNTTSTTQTPFTTALTVGQAIPLTGLQPNQLYQAWGVSRDPAGNLATSADFTITTKAPGIDPTDTTPPTISGVQAVSVATSAQSSDMTWSWTTDDWAYGWVEFGPGGSLQFTTPEDGGGT